MPFATGSRTRLSFIPEVTYGVTPSTPTMQTISYSNQSLAPTKDLVESSDINADRMSRHERHGNKQSGGSISVDLREDEYDLFLESALFNSFTANVLKTGTSLKSFTIEASHLDIGQHFLYTGQVVNQMSVSIAPNQMVQTSFDFIGKDATLNAASVAGSVLASTTNPPMDSFNGTINLQGGGAELIVSALDFTVNNNINPAFVIGSDVSQNLIYGRSTVTGNMSVYFEDEDVINYFLNEDEVDVVVTVAAPSGAKDFTFTFPRTKFNSGSAPVDGDGAIIVPVSFTALYDTGEDTNIKISRTT